MQMHELSALFDGVGPLARGLLRSPMFDPFFLHESEPA